MNTTVTAPMVADFLAYLTNKYALSTAAKDSAVVNETLEGSTVVNYQIKIDSTWFWVSYEENKDELTFTTHYSQEYTSKCAEIVKAVANGFTEALAQEKYQQNFKDIEMTLACHRKKRKK